MDKEFIQNAVEVYSDMILRIAFSYTFNKADSEDIMQEVFIKLLKQPRFSDETHLKAWFIRVTINRSKDFLKSQKRKPVALFDNLGYNFSPGDQDVMSAIQSLPPVDRDILYLFYTEGYTAKEIGGIVNIKENTVHVRLKRLRLKLKTLLEEE